MAIRPADHGVVAAQGGGLPLLYSQSGGTVSVSGLYTYILWNASGSLTITGNIRDIEWFTLCGGGSGGKANQNGSGAGGGGAGRAWAQTITNMAAEVHTVTICAGAAAQTGPPTAQHTAGNDGGTPSLNPARIPSLSIPAACGAG